MSFGTAQARHGTVPPLLRGLVRTTVRRAAEEEKTDVGALRQRLAGLPDEERDRVLVELVRTHAAAVLGHDRAEMIEAERGFLDIGFDSLTALELRTRLTEATGCKLPPTLIFDHPSATAAAAYLRVELLGAEKPASDLDSATAAELFDILDNELEVSE